jgi:low affinity Fe/Cu permease
MAAHPGAFGILIGYAVLWFIFDRDSFDWHAGATLIVWFMALLIQRAEHRDTQALQAKIDELLHANAQADSAMMIKSMTMNRRTLSAFEPRPA